MTWACKPACMHAMCLHAQAHITAKLGWIREIKISMESEHARPLWTHNLTWARRLACMHTMCLHAQAYFSAKLGQIREIKVSMESGEHAGPVWAHMTPAHKLVCIHVMFLHAGDDNSTELENRPKASHRGQSPLSRPLQEPEGGVPGCQKISMGACMLFSCMQWPISQPNHDKSERARYKLNQGNIPVLWSHNVT